MCLLNFIGGAFKHKPEELESCLTRPASDLIAWAFEDIDRTKLIDYHTHIAGVGSGGSNAFVNPRMMSWRYPFHRIKFAVYLNACAIKQETLTDSEYINRLVDLIRYNPHHGKHRLLAFDKNYHVDGSVNLHKTEFYVPNKYVFDIAEKYPDLFEPVISVNPYRNDAVAELEKWSNTGGRLVKWLPNAMGIDPSNPKCDRFYETMKQKDLVLLSHGGEEKAVEAAEDQKLGNPLLLRRALDHGVKVIVAHCAGLGSNEDLDSPHREMRSNFRLFLRLMEEKRYEGLLFGEISAMTQYNRVGDPLRTILEREDLHPRLVNGSDYPLPAINFLIRINPLIEGGFLDRTKKPLLKEIYSCNPLLFDFVLKRCLTAPETGGRLPAAVFYQNELIESGGSKQT
jgi:predicted TIM-barrel fold metal-dependent hydrolase